jgi:hypothetical protein
MILLYQRHTTLVFLIASFSFSFSECDKLFSEYSGEFDISVDHIVSYADNIVLNNEYSTGFILALGCVGVLPISFR